MDKEQSQVILFFDIPASDVKTFMVDLGKALVGGKEIKIPPLNYRREYHYFYQPISFWGTLVW